MIKIPATHYRALCAVVPRADDRFFLLGIHIDPDGHAVSTNGHSMLIYDLPPAPESAPYVSAIYEPVKIPARAHSVSIDQAEKTLTAYDKHESPISSHPLHAIDGTYPDWRRVYDTRAPASHIGINPAYIAAVTAPLKSTKIKMEFSGDHAPTKIQFLDVPGVKMILMPLRT
jgi:hypothetical protein